MDKCAIQAVHAAEARKVAGTGELEFITLEGDGDVRIHFLGKLTQGAFHLHHVTVENFYFHAGRKVYR